MLTGNFTASTTEVETTRHRVLALALMIALAAGFGVIVLNVSYWFGRLATVPLFDDCGYFLDGAMRYREFRLHGISSIPACYMRVHPHSPFSTYMAFASYLIFGLKMYAPYALNTVLVFILLLFLNSQMRGVSLLRKLFVFSFALSVPFTTYLITEFRPDLACALFITIGEIMGLERNWSEMSFKRRFGIGAFFGIAMLTKPTVFPQTVFFFGATLGLAMAIERITEPQTFRFVTALRSALVAVLAFFLIALPHFFFTLDYLVFYIKEGLVSQHDIWALHGSIWEHIRYYLDGIGGTLMLGHHLYLLPLLIGGSLLILHRSPNEKPRVLRVCALLILLGISYLGPTLNPVKTQFFGANFFCMLTLLGTLSFRHIGEWLSEHRDVKNLGVVFAALGIAPALPGLLTYAVLIATMVYCFASMRHTVRTKIMWYGIVGVGLFAAYCVPWLRQELRDHFSNRWELAAWIAGTLLILEFYEYLFARRKPVQWLAFMSVCALGLLVHRGQERLGFRHSPEFIARAKTNQELYAYLKSRTQREVAPAKAVFFTAVGAINAVTISLCYYADDLLPPDVMTTDIKGVPAEVANFLDRADVVVASEADNPEVYNLFPNGQFQAELLEYIRGDPRFVETSRIDTFNHKAYILFDKKTKGPSEREAFKPKAPKK